MASIQRWILFAAAVTLAACGGKSVNSGPIGVGISAEPGDVTNEVLTQDKGIGSDTGNPYHDFIVSAEGQLDNKAPTRLEISGLTLGLGASSQGVTTLDQVFGKGEVDVLFKVDPSNLTYAVGHANDVTGAGPDDFTVDFNPDQLPASDLQALINGQAHVVIRGPAAATFPGSGAKADLELRFTFQASE